MLTNTIASCISAIQDKRYASDRKKSLDEYKAALLKLNEACSVMDSVQKCCDALVSQDIHSTAIFEESTKMVILDAIDTCGRGLAEGSLGSESVNTFIAAAKTANAELNATWQKAAPLFSDGTAGYLSMIAGLTNNPVAARELCTKIQTLSRASISAKNINELASCVNLAKGTTSSFSLKPEIEAFLKKVSSGQASIADLSPAVQDWLTEKGLKQKLRICF